MTSKMLSLASLIALVLCASSAEADVCDYKPSSLIGKAAAAIGTTVSGTGALAGIGMNSAGYYTLVHAGSGLTMLGSTAAGSSAAGTIGIIAGTGGVAGTLGAFVMSPITITVGSITAVGVGAFEGVCLTQVERISDPYDVRRIVESAAAHDHALAIVASEDGDSLRLTIDGQTETYLLRDLYIADWQLKHRDWGFNTDLGPIFFGRTDDIADGPDGGYAAALSSLLRIVADR